eukprot:4352821-Pyramimonas_sp.AAC.1
MASLILPRSAYVWPSAPSTRRGPSRSSATSGRRRPLREAAPYWGGDIGHCQGRPRARPFAPPASRRHGRGMSWRKP